MTPYVVVVQKKKTPYMLSLLRYIQIDDQCCRWQRVTKSSSTLNCCDWSIKVESDRFYALDKSYMLVLIVVMCVHVDF